MEAAMGEGGGILAAPPVAVALVGVGARPAPSERDEPPSQEEKAVSVCALVAAAGGGSAPAPLLAVSARMAELSPRPRRRLPDAGPSAR